MLGTWLVIVFRVLHILAGAFWFGGVAVTGGFIFPSAFAIGPAAAPFMDQLGRVRKLPMNLMGAGVITVLSGFVLFWNDSAGAPGVWAASSMGTIIGAGALLALIAMVVNLPTVKKINALSAEIQAQGGPPSAEQQETMKAMQRKLLTAIRIVLVLLLLATAFMAVARYVP
jgi:uncharacterized membrane protein